MKDFSGCKGILSLYISRNIEGKENRLTMADSKIIDTLWDDNPVVVTTGNIS